MAKKKKKKNKSGGGFFQWIYNLLSYVYLQYAMLILCVGAILWLTGVFQTSPAVKTIFFVALGISIVLAVFFTIKKLFNLGKKEEKDVGDVSDVVKEEFPTEREAEKQEPFEPRYKEPIEDIEDRIIPVYPKYYRVKQNNNYVMAEYADRYELFYDTGKGLMKVRTDYKKG